MDSQQAFSEAVSMITARIAGKKLDADLQSFLDESFPPGGEAFDDLAELCRQGIDAGWLCEREHDGIKFGRIIKQGPATNGFPVDVVLMDDMLMDDMVRAISKRINPGSMEEVPVRRVGDSPIVVEAGGQLEHKR